MLKKTNVKSSYFGIVSSATAGMNALLSCVLFGLAIAFESESLLTVWAIIFLPLWITGTITGMIAVLSRRLWAGLVLNILLGAIGFLFFIGGVGLLIHY